MGTAMKVIVVLALTLGGVWAIAAGFPPAAIPAWVGAIAVAGSRSAKDGIDSFFGVTLVFLLAACALMLVWQFVKAVLGF